MAWKPDRWTDPRKAASPNERVAHDYEAVALAAIMHMHRDAVAFYKVAAAQLDDPEAEEICRALQGLHDEAVGAAWGLLQEKEAPSFFEESDTDAMRFFSPVMHQLPYGVTHELTDAVAAAEEASLHAMEEALGPASEGAKELLMGMLSRLEAGHGLALRLRDIARRRETPVAPGALEG